MPKRRTEPAAGKSEPPILARVTKFAASVKHSYFFSEIAMRALVLLVLLLAAVPAFADEKSDKANTDELKAMAGTWVIEKVSVEGKDFTETFKAMELILTEDGKYSVSFAGMTDKGTSTVDTSKTPRELDIQGEEGPNKGKGYKCIYKFDVKAKTLEVCYNLDESKRPTDFASKPDSKTMLINYKRK
jgi:uncharacterized protein (TIGR03067 family)